MNDIRHFSVRIEGASPLLMHQDNIEWADAMDEWKARPRAKGASRAGDDRSPGFRWLGSLYHDETHIAMPTDNLRTCLMEGGAFVQVPNAKNGKTFKAQTQSGIAIADPHWPLYVSDKLIDVAPLFALKSEETFAPHREIAKRSGFALMVKRAKVGMSKHVRVRPLFDNWAIAGVVTVWDDAISEPILRDILNFAGRYKGIGDWRPGSPKSPGNYGMFTATVKPAT